MKEEIIKGRLEECSSMVIEDEKEYKKRRTREGMVLAIKDKLKVTEIIWKKEESKKVKGVKFKRSGETYLIILVYMNKEKEKKKEIMEKWIDDLESRVIICGD